MQAQPLNQVVERESFTPDLGGRTERSVRIVELANGTRFEVVLDRAWMLGLGRVWVRDVQLRSGKECIYPQIATPDGWEVAGYELLSIRQDADGVCIRTRPHYRVAYRMDWTEHALHPRHNTASWSGGVVAPDAATLEWRIKPARARYSDVDYDGLSYQFHYDCPGKAIYQIQDKATWELGGNIAGSTFILRGAFANPLTHFAPETAYDSAWTLPGIANPYIFQHLPLYTQLQGFTFQYDATHVLLTAHDHPSHVRSLFHRDAGSEVMLHFNQFCFDLADQATPPARRILVARRPTGNTAMLNHFLRVRDEIQGKIREHYGVRHDPPRPSAHVETWSIARIANLGPIFEQLHQWGIRRAFVMPLWRSNETDLKPLLGDRIGRFGVVGNMCCPLELEIADCYGGWEGLRKAMETARRLGMETYTWVAPHLSSMTPLINTIPSLLVHDVSGQFDRNNYGHVLMACNHNSPQFQDYLLAAIAKLKACGLSGVFRDSHFNMATDTLNFTHPCGGAMRDGGVTPDHVGAVTARSEAVGDRVQSQHDAEISIQRRVQHELGMLYYVESAGVLGTPMCGTNYEWVRGQEFIWSNIETAMKIRRERGDDPVVCYFRGLSVKLFFQLNVEVNGFPAPEAIDNWWDPDRMPAMLNAYHAVEPYLQQMWLMDDDGGIRWTGGECEVLFTYKDLMFEVPDGQHVQDVMGDRMLRGQKVALAAYGIYVVKRG